MTSADDPRLAYLNWLNSSTSDVAVLCFTEANLSEVANTEQLGDELNLLVDHFEFHHVVLSFRNVRFLSSSVLGKLISFHRRIKRLEGKLVLCEFSDPLIDVLTTSNLLKYFQIAESVDQAQNDMKQSVE